jgi:hypothetical protein
VRRLALTVCLAVLLLGCGADEDADEQPASSPTLADLRVAVDPDGKGGKPARTSEIRCAAIEDSAVCAKVARLEPADLEPAGEAVACTQQYGGPQTATVTGTLRGEPVDLQFTRVNGCEIARWEAARALLQ